MDENVKVGWSEGSDRWIVHVDVTHPQSDQASFIFLFFLLAFVPPLFLPFVPLFFLKRLKKLLSSAPDRAPLGFSAFLPVSKLVLVF